MVKIQPRLLQDHFSSGTIDVVTDRVKSKWLTICGALIFPLIIVNLTFSSIVSYVPDQWTFANATDIIVLNKPERLILGEPMDKRLEMIAINKASLPVMGLRVRASVISVSPEPDFSFCSDLIPGTFEHERLSAVCAPILSEHEIFTNGSGMVDFRNMAAVGGVPGVWEIKIQVFYAATRRVGGQAVTTYTPTAETQISMRVYRNMYVQIERDRAPPAELEFGQVMDGSDWYCSTPIDFGRANCSNNLRIDLSPPSARVIYSGNSSLSNHTRMVLFSVSNFSEVLMPELSVPRSRTPSRVMSTRKMARLSNGTSFNFTEMVSSTNGRAIFYNTQVVASNNPSLFLAFYSCGRFELWNTHYAEGGAHMAVEITLNPPLQAGRTRAAQGTVWASPSQDLPLEQGGDGTMLGDQTYLSQIEIADYPLVVREGEPFEVVMNAFTWRYPRSRQQVLFPSGVVILAEAVPAFPVPGATDAHSFWARSKKLTGASSRESSAGDVGVAFTDLRFTLAGEVGDYKLRFYTEGMHQVMASGPVCMYEYELLPWRTRIHLHITLAVTTNSTHVMDDVVQLLL
jgi:hypothetical protein